MEQPQDRLTYSINEEEKRSQAIQSLISANGLQYKTPPKLNIVNDRKWSSSVSQGRSLYNLGDCIEISLQSGTQFVDPKSVALVFTVECVGGTNSTLSNTAIDLINGLKICTHNGTEIYNERNINQRVALMLPYLADKSVFEATGSVFGSSGEQLRVAGGVKYVVPFHLFCGLFDMDTLLPSHLVMGLHISIILESNKNKVVTWAGAPSGVDTIQVKDPSIISLNSSLSDGIVREISQMSSKRGLSIPFHSFENVVASSNTDRIVMDSKRALSRTVDCFVARVKSTPVPTENSFLAVPYDTADWYFKFGGSVLPETCGTHKDSKLSYYLALNAFNKSQDTRRDCSVSHQDFLQEGRAIHAVSLERSSAIALSGRSVASGSILSFEATFDTAGNYDYHMFLRYVSLLNVALDNVVLKV